MDQAKQFFNGFKKGLEQFGGNIGLIVNSVLLSVVYFLAVGVTAFFAKLARKHFLETKLSKKGTYWAELNLKKKKTEEYYKQF